MYINIPIIETVLSHRIQPFSFYKTVEKQIELFEALEEIEKDLGLNVQDYAQSHQVTAYFLDWPVIQRKGFQLIMDAFTEQKQKFNELRLFLPESEMDSEKHKNYLQVVALLEIYGSIILNPYKLKIISRNCSDCDPYYIEVDPSIASVWAMKVVRKINLPAFDHRPKCVFGHYDIERKDFY